MITLKSLSTNKISVIKEIQNDELKTRMYDIGLYPSQVVEVVKRAPLGDPMIVQVNEQLVMLRSIEADLIMVEEIAAH